MTLFWVGLVGGVWIGSTIGFIFAAMLAANRRKEDYE